MLTIELEAALPQTPGATAPAKLTSPYRSPLTKYLCVYADQAIAYFLDSNRMTVFPPSPRPPRPIAPLLCYSYV